MSPFCCKYLKKEPSHKYEKEFGKYKIMGVMGSESLNRAMKYTSCFSKDKSFHPLWDLTEELRDDIEKQYGIPVPYIYQYTNQTGCAGCPYGQHGKNKFVGTDIELSLCGSGQQKFILEYFKESYAFKGYKFTPMLF